MVIFILSSPTRSFSENSYFDFDGKIIEQFLHRNLKDDYLLNPDRDIINFSHWKNRLYADLNLKLGYKNISFITKSRPTLFSEDGDSDFKVIFDDAYLDIMFKERYFFYVGKKNIRDGVGLGENPTDFLGEGKKVDPAKSEEERRVEREGNHLIGLDAFFDNFSLSAVFAPRINGGLKVGDRIALIQEQKDRIRLKCNFFFESLNTDLSLHYFQGEIPGIGFNLSKTIGEKLVLYSESAFRWGSDIPTIKLTQTGTLIPNVTERNDFNKIYPHILVGGHYTFKDGTNIICEYIYNGDGYNSKQWREFKDFTKKSHDTFKNGFFRESMRSNLLLANETIKFREARRNYIFTRVSNPNIKEKFDSAIVFLLNADDRSFLINPRVDYKATTNLTIGFSSTIFVGENDSEFGMLHWHNDTNIFIKYFF